MNALYDGRGEPVFAETLPPAHSTDTNYCTVVFDHLQHAAWEGGVVDLILQLSDASAPFPRHYLEHLTVCIISGGFIAVHGPDAEAVVEVVETITAAAEVTQ